MSVLLFIFLFIFGTIIGSFLNVVILRYNTGRSIAGRSGCFSCGIKLASYDLFPLVSFCALLGRCRHCRSKLSWQYPLVELATGLSFLAIGTQLLSPFGTIVLTPYLFATLILLFAIVSVLIVIFAYDVRHKIIPDALAYGFAVLGLLFSVVSAVSIHGLSTPLIFSTVLNQLLAGFLAFLPFYCLWKFSGGRWMGLGDGKLAIGIGTFLGITKGFTAIIFGFWVGAAISLLFIGLQRLQKTVSRSRSTLTLKSEIPFGPFLIIGVAIVYATGTNLFLPDTLLTLRTLGDFLFSYFL